MNKRHVEDDEGDDRKHIKVTLDTTGHPCVSKEVIAQNLEWWRALGSNVLSEVRQVEMRNYDLLVMAECDTGQYASETSKQCRKRSKQYWQWSCETRFNANPRRESVACLVDNCEYEDEYNPYRVMFRLKGTKGATCATRVTRSTARMGATCLVNSGCTSTKSSKCPRTRATTRTRTRTTSSSLKIKNKKKIFFFIFYFQ